ncbi:MAG TPA: anti-sigma factor [Phycisphaerales bacterium]|nr:anti-sigma factor [Phycisphaerales bacterium]
MSTFSHHQGNSHPDRYLELAADYALGELEAQEAAEFDRYVAQHGDVSHEMNHAATMLHLAMLRKGDLEPLPKSLEARLLASAEQFAKQPANGSRNGYASPAPSAREAAPVAGRIGPTRMSPVPWVLAAAAITIAAVGWLRPSGKVVIAPKQEQPVAAKLETSPDLVRVKWGDWDNPEVKGVTGEIAWSDAAQTGVMTFRNLPALDETKERYQLWIIDSRGMEQRISGGVFNGGEGETRVTVTPGIRVVGAAAFAVTIERPEGTWVSDMKRRVVIAAKG